MGLLDGRICGLSGRTDTLTMRLDIRDLALSSTTGVIIIEQLSQYSACNGRSWRYRLCYVPD